MINHFDINFITNFLFILGKIRTGRMMASLRLVLYSKIHPSSVISAMAILFTLCCLRFTYRSGPSENILSDYELDFKIAEKLSIPLGVGPCSVNSVTDIDMIWLLKCVTASTSNLSLAMSVVVDSAVSIVLDLV